MWKFPSNTFYAHVAVTAIVTVGLVDAHVPSATFLHFIAAIFISVAQMTSPLFFSANAAVSAVVLAKKRHGALAAGMCAYASAIWPPAAVLAAAVAVAVAQTYMMGSVTQETERALLRNLDRDEAALEQTVRAVLQRDPRLQTPVCIQCAPSRMWAERTDPQVEQWVDAEGFGPASGFFEENEAGDLVRVPNEALVPFHPNQQVAHMLQTVAQLKETMQGERVRVREQIHPKRAIVWSRLAFVVAAGVAGWVTGRSHAVDTPFAMTPVDAAVMAVGGIAVGAGGDVVHTGAALGMWLVRHDGDAVAMMLGAAAALKDRRLAVPLLAAAGGRLRLWEGVPRDMALWAAYASLFIGLIGV